MTFGIIALILVGASWIVWGYVGGHAPQRKLDMGIITALCGTMAVVLSLIALGILLILQMQGVALPQFLSPVIPDFSQANVWLILAVMIVGGIFNFGQLVFMSRAMKDGPNGIIWSIVQAGFIVPFALGILCFGEPMSWSFALALLLVIVALVIFGVTADNSAKGHWLLFALCAFAATCVCQSMQYIPSNFSGIENVSSVWRTMFFFGGMPVGFLLTLLFDSQTRRRTTQLLKEKYTWYYALLIDGVEVVVCCCLQYPGLDALADSNMGAISTQLMTASGIVAFELYAVLILKEKRKALQVLALLLCLGSIAAVCFKF